MDHLIEDVLSGDHERKTSVIASIFNFHDSEPENIPELLYKMRHLLGNYESSSRGEALSFLKELFDGFPADAINEDCRDFIVVQTLHAFVDENCSIRDMKHALQLLDTVANRLHIKKLMSNEEDSMQNLGRKLPGIGDFEVQSLLLKLLCKVADYGDEKFWSSVWFNKEDVRREFLKTVIVNNPTKCRIFLNLVNRSEEYEKVFSFVAQAVSSNSVQLKKPNSLGDIWIDLNFDSRSISFCCEKFNDNNHQTVCIQAQSVEKYSLTTLVAAQVQELCIMLNCPFSDFLQEDIPFLDTSNLLIIRFWKFLNVNNYLKKIFGLPFNEIDGTSDNHCNRKVSQSQYLRSSDPQRYAATKTDDRKISRSCEIISTSLPTDVERQALSRNVSNSSDVERQTLSRKVSNSSDVFSFPDLKASMATIKKQRKVSNSYDAIPYDSNEVPTETQRSTQRKMSCSSEIIPVNDNEDEECYEPTPVHSNENHRRRTPSTSKTNSNTPHSKDSNGSAQQKHVSLEYTKPKVIQLPISPAESENAAASDSESKPAKLSRTKRTQENPCNRMNKSELQPLSQGIKVGSQSHNGYSEPVAETKLSKNNCQKKPRNLYNSQKRSRGKGLQRNSSENYYLRRKKPSAKTSKPVVVDDSLDVYSDEILSVILEETVTQVVDEAYNSPVSVHNSKETRLAKSSLNAINKQNGSVSQQKVPRSRRERTLSAEKVLEQVQQSSSFHSIETLHSPENKKLKSVTDNNEIDRDHSQLRNSPHILIVKENGANESSKEFQEDDNRQDADVRVVGDDELHPNSSATVRQTNKPASPENSEIEKLSQSRDSVLSRSKTKNDSKDLQIDELVSKDSDMNRKVPSPPGTNRERRYAIKSFASSRKNARHPHLQAYHENPKSPVDVLVLSDKQSSAEEEPVQGDDLEPHPSPEYFRKESNLNEESRSGKMPKTASKKFFKSTQRRKKLFDADRSSPVHIRNLSENTSSNRYKSKRTSLPRKPVPEKVTSAHRDSSSESDFRPLNWKRSKKSERNKTVSNDSGFREQSSASKSWNSSLKTKRVPPISEDEPDENISHGDNLRAETPHSNVFSPSNNDQDNRLSNSINEFTDYQVGKSPKPHTPIPDWNAIQYSLGFYKDPNGAKLSRTVSQPLEEETESVRRKKLDESLKIMKARSNSSSSGSAHRRLQRNSVKPKKVLKKLFISDTETDSSGLSWTKSKQVRLFQSPKKTFFKRKTVSSASKFKSPLRIQPKRNPPSSKIKSVKAKRNSSKKNTSERPPNSSPDPYSVFDEPEYTVESHKKPPSGASLSRLSTTPRRRLPSISEDGQSFDAVHNDLTLIPGDSVSERMETPPDSNLSASKKGKRVHKPHILKVTPQKSPTENDIAFNRSGRKRVESRRGSDDNFVDITSGPDEVFEEPPPSHQESTRLSRNSRGTNASVSESRLRQNSSVQNDSCLDESGKISPDRTIYASDIYDLQNIPVAEECSPPSKTSSNLRKENVRSFSEEMIDENEKVDQYLQSLSEASVIDGKEKPDSDSVEAKSIGDKSDSNQLENEVEEQNVDIDVINALDDPSITERASPIEILDDEESLNKEKELLRKSNSSKEILGKSTNISEKRKIGKKRKFEEKNENPNLGTVKNIGSSKCLAREHQTLKKSFDESKEQRNLRKEAKMKNMRELSDITSSKKRKYKDFVDLEEIEFLGKDHHQIEESIEREAEEISEMKESKTIKSRKDKQEKEIDSSTLVPNWRSIRNSLDIYESAALAMNPITKKRFKKYKTSTPKPGKDLMYLNQKHCSSLFSLQESLEKLSFKLFQTLKKFHKQFIMEMAFSRQTMVSYINILLQESECSETDLEYLYESIQERRKHITNSINKMMQMAKEYFEKEQKWNRKFGQLQAKVIGKYTVKVYEVEKLAIDSVMKRMLSDAQNKFNSLINDFKYY